MIGLGAAGSLLGGGGGAGLAGSLPAGGAATTGDIKTGPVTAGVEGGARTGLILNFAARGAKQTNDANAGAGAINPVERAMSPHTIGLFVALGMIALILVIRLR